MERETTTTTDDLLIEYLKRERASCPNCGYELHGNESANCPECGCPIELSIGPQALKAGPLVLLVSGPVYLLGGELTRAISIFRIWSQVRGAAMPIEARMLIIWAIMGLVIGIGSAVALWIITSTVERFTAKPRRSQWLLAAVILTVSIAVALIPHNLIAIFLAW